MNYHLSRYSNVKKIEKLYVSELKKKNTAPVFW